jgi:hypothetical protein
MHAFTRSAFRVILNNDCLSFETDSRLTWPQSIQNLETIDRIQPWLSSYQLIQTLMEEHTAELGSQGSKLATEIKKLQEEVSDMRLCWTGHHCCQGSHY